MRYRPSSLIIFSLFIARSFSCIPVYPFVHFFTRYCQVLYHNKTRRLFSPISTNLPDNLLTPVLPASFQGGRNSNTCIPFDSACTLVSRYLPAGAVHFLGLEFARQFLPRSIVLVMPVSAIPGASRGFCTIFPLRRYPLQMVLKLRLSVFHRTLFGDFHRSPNSPVQPYRSYCSISCLDIFAVVLPAAGYVLQSINPHPGLHPLDFAHAVHISRHTIEMMCLVILSKPVSRVLFLA